MFASFLKFEYKALEILEQFVFIVFMPTELTVVESSVKYRNTEGKKKLFPINKIFLFFYY